MRPKQEHKKLFQELEQCSHRKDSFSVDDFLKEKGISFSDFDLISEGSKKFGKIWGEAEHQAWENLQEALHTKSLPRSQIAEYIKQSEVFQDEDPEEVMHNLESGKARVDMYECALNGGNAGEIMRRALTFGVVTQEQYNEFLEIGGEEDEDPVTSDVPGNSQMLIFLGRLRLGQSK